MTSHRPDRTSVSDAFVAAPYAFYTPACLVAVLLVGCGGVERYNNTLEYQAAVTKLALKGSSLTEAQRRLAAEGYACVSDVKFQVRPPFYDVACSRRSAGWVCVQPQHIYLHYSNGEERVEEVTAGVGTDVCL